ncbi:hypothetical protein [Actinokineospora diospyrosa]|uniref:Uncharacterized protein n=1 Tax=Actinokineospora diospyrosa TaxID=103728 RepID=A0ABT1INA4_9PSEU|nr:hypothetical protein [Actinokineospora diospyrosa]MCP2273963.1 hypothetical protein [Actinokineospora diospyrosa]
MLGRTRIVASLVAALATAGLTTVVSAGTAAADVPVVAPYASYAAVVDKDGKLLRGKNVEEVKRTDTGRYCVKFSAPFDANSAIVSATLNFFAFPGSIRVSPGASGSCGNDVRSVYVAAVKLDGGKFVWSDAGFTVVAF